MQVITAKTAKKSGLIAAFFCLIILFATSHVCAAIQAPQAGLEQQALQLGLANRSAWNALLHTQDAKANIVDQNFLISAPAFSPERELVETLQLLASDRATYCRFPARALWLSMQLNLPQPDLQHCAGLQEFLHRAPAQKIALVFASENITQPSSMMGHAFLKISGKNENGAELQHAISFYTDAATLNFPKLFWDSMVVGKQGLFALSPYDERLNDYLYNENRNVWEYVLRLTEQERLLVLYHLWELKQTRLVYFFQNYNCATLLHFLLSVVKPVANAGNVGWLTPKDVVKQAVQSGLVESSTARMSSRWMVRELGRAVPADRKSLIANAIRADQLMQVLADAKQPPQYLELEFAAAYAQYLKEQKLLDSKQYVQHVNQIVELEQKYYPDLHLESAEESNPALTPPDGQWSLGFAYSSEHGAEAIYRFLPASHRFEGDHHQYSSESELLLADFQFALALKSRQLKLDRFTLYSVKAVTPFDSLTGGWSGEFRLGYGPQHDQKLQLKRAAYIEGGAGLATRYFGALDVYGIAGGGLRTRLADRGYAYIDYGLVARHGTTAKTILSMRRNYGLGSVQAKYDQIQLAQQFYLKPDLTLQWKLENLRNRQSNKSRVELSYIQLF